MSFHHGLKVRLWCFNNVVSAASRRALHVDGRNRLSNFWTPTQSKKLSKSEQGSEDGHDLLVRAGFLRQAHSGIFHLLPLGLRVQDKIERLIDKHMQNIGASKVSLSSLSSQELWRKSGRLEGKDSELFQLVDRKDGKYLLAPTHEEEITTIVKSAVHSYRDLPLRLYQVSRKYRDEARPRQGLLRGREFIMKDLYTFDVTEQSAMETYEAVRAAYRGFLDEMNLPYLVANADSGNMGGTHSHEYHFVSPNGEDTIITCTNCDISINEELYFGKYDPARVDGTSGASYTIKYGHVPRKPGMTESPRSDAAPSSETAQSTSKGTLVQVLYPTGFELNTHALKKLVPGIVLNEQTEQKDTTDKPEKSQRADILVRDPRVSPYVLRKSPDSKILDAPFLLTQPRHDDACPSCGHEGGLRFHQAVEIGHTFHLGKRYSKPFEATVTDKTNQLVEMEMGCHGIGVSRLIGAIASILADRKGLNWPISLAPFGVVVVGVDKTPKDDINEVYDRVSSSSGKLDAVIDDREREFGWNLGDADLIGYPFIIILGRAWKQRRAVELQCRRLKVKEEVSVEELAQKIDEYSAKL